MASSAFGPLVSSLAGNSVPGPLGDAVSAFGDAFSGKGKPVIQPKSPTPDHSSMAFPVSVGSSGLPTPVKTETGPTGVASSSLADQTLETQKNGYGALLSSMNGHAEEKKKNGGTVNPANPEGSIVDLLNSKGMPADFASRAKLAQTAGIKDYAGTAQQNAQLIGYVNNPPKDTGTPATGGTPAGGPGGAPAGAAGGPAGSNAPLTEQQQYQKDVSEGVSEYQKNVDQHVRDIDALADGTFPLTASQQATLDATKAAFEQTRALQLKANESYENSIALAGNRLGLNLQNPREYLAQGQQAISDDIGRIANLDALAAKTMNDLRQGFMDKDYKYINDKYDALQGALKEKQDAIDKLHKDSIDQQKDLRDYNEKVAEFTKNYDLEVQKMNQPSYTLHDNPDGSVSLFNSKTGAVKNIPAAEVAGAQGKEPGNTGVSIIDGNTKRTASGVPYIDGSSLTGKTAESAQQAAALYGGIPYLSANESGAMDKLQTARSNLYDINNDITGILPKDALGRTLGGAANNRLSSYFQTNAEKASFNTWRSAAIGVLQALAGGAGSGLRINQSEIALSVANDIPYITDTAAVAQAKIAKVNAMIGNQEHQLLGAGWYDKYDPEYAVKDLTMFSSSSPEHAAQVDKIHADNPDLTPYQVLQLAQP